MKSILLVSLGLASFMFASPQKKVTFFVEYLYEQRPTSSFLPDTVQRKKIDVKIKYSTDSATKEETVESTVGNLLTSSFNFATWVAESAAPGSIYI
jgi:hypothetical protein